MRIRFNLQLQSVYFVPDDCRLSLQSKLFIIFIVVINIKESPYSKNKQSNNEFSSVYERLSMSCSIKSFFCVLSFRQISGKVE